MSRCFAILILVLAVSCGSNQSPVRFRAPPERSVAPLDVEDCISQCGPTNPIEYGTCDLSCVQVAVGNAAPVQVLTADNPAGQAALDAAGVTLDPSAESFQAVPGDGSTTVVVGRDQTGAMYGAMQLAEQLQLSGPDFLPIALPLGGAPAVRIRAANLFLVLPAPGEDVWWFLDSQFWTQYLDLLAQSRMNFLDLHAMYNLDNTIFPNALLYFATSATYPQVGVAADAREQNLAMLNTVIQMAAVRGIDVGLMSYRSDARPTGDGTPQLADGSDQLSQYTREAARDLATRASGLRRLGFRIGESGQPASWYIDTFIAGVQDAGTGVQIYTRTWGTTKPDILSIVSQAGPDTVVEAKYNGEHLAAPYAIAGGKFSSSWRNYSYENYLNPPVPYPFVFQIRAGGTHRAFRYAAYERTRRTALNFLMSPDISGFTLEAAHAYFPQRDPFHASADQFSPWTFRRDELSYLLFGRLTYDPTTPPDVFRLALQSRVGTDGLWDSVQAASEIVPWIQTAHTCGPDQRDYAPELEFGGHVAYWSLPSNGTRPPHSCGSAHQPFDQFAISLPDDVANDLVQGAITTRVSPLEVARTVLADAQQARTAASVMIDSTNPEARDVVNECIALADLGEWYGHKLRSASALAVYRKTAAAGYLDAARAETDLAGQAWTSLANDTSYILSFVENLRMRGLGVSPFHWSLPTVLNRLAEDPSSIDAVEAMVIANPPSFSGDLPLASDWLNTPRSAGPGLVFLDVSPLDPTASNWTVSAAFGSDLPAGSQVNILWKPFAGAPSDWQSAAASQVGSTYQAAIAGGGQGGMFAVEILSSTGAGWRYPDLFQETPYRTLAP
jgi:hypothetical protein